MRPRDFSRPAREVAAVVRVLDASAAEASESYRAISSANCTLGTGEETKGASRVYILKRTGPRTEPWGTTQVQAKAGTRMGSQGLIYRKEKGSWNYNFRYNVHYHRQIY